MHQISANVAALNQKIQKLRDLKKECEEINVEPTEIVGSGQTIDVLVMVEEEYAEIKTAILTLMTNSIGFFENVSNSMAMADRMASRQILLK